MSKELRKEKGLTQEQLDEQFNVSNRTVSRWETGSSMPDLDILIEISDFYGIDFRELLNGERRSEKMNEKTDNELKDVALKAANYTNMESERYTRRINAILLVGAVLWFISQLINHTGLIENYVMNAISDFFEGVACALIICGLFVATCRYGQKLEAYKKRLLNKN